MPLPSAPDEYVDIDGFGLYEWIDIDWTPLLDGADLKGTDIDISHTDGSYVNPRHVAETTYVCTGWLHGTMLFDGTPASDLDDARRILRENLAFLRGYICADTATDDPTRTLTLHGDPDWSAEVIIDRHLSLATESETSLAVVLRVTVPAGELVAEGS